MTEKETEEWLQYERRDIAWPDGRVYSMNADRVFWNAFNFILKTRLFSMEEMMRFTHRTMETKGYSFEDALQSVVACINQAQMQRP